MNVSPALNVEADNIRAHLELQISDLQLRNERLALSNRMLRDRVRDLLALLRGFGVALDP